MRLATTVNGRHIAFELLVELLPNPELTLKNLSTNGLAVSLTDVKRSFGAELSSRDVDNATRLVEFAVPCLGHAISRSTATNFLKSPVSSSKVINAHSNDFGNHERLVSSSYSSCQNCAYAFKLFQNRGKKRKASSLEDVPDKKCNLRYLDNTRKKEDACMIEFVDDDDMDLPFIFKDTNSTLLPPPMG